MFNFSVTTVPADGLALLDARTSAGEVITKFYMGLALKGWYIML